MLLTVEKIAQFVWSHITPFLSRSEINKFPSFESQWNRSGETLLLNYKSYAEKVIVSNHESKINSVFQIECGFGIFNHMLLANVGWTRRKSYVCTSTDQTLIIRPNTTWTHIQLTLNKLIIHSLQINSSSFGVHFGKSLESHLPFDLSCQKPNITHSNSHKHFE